MQGAKIKINFFENEIDSISQFKHRLEKVLELTKSALKSHDPQKAQTNVYKIQQMLKKQIKNLTTQVKKTKRIIGCQEDEGEQERKIIFQCLDAKIDELNDRLFVAEECVQKAEMIKKKNDALNKDINSQYEMSNTKTFKKLKQQKIIEAYIQSNDRLKTQIQRFIQMVFQTNLHQQQNQPDSSLQKILQAKFSRLHYQQMNQQMNQQIRNQHNIRCQSVKKYAKSYVPVQKMLKKQKKPLLKIIIGSSELQNIIKHAILDLTVSTQLNNRKITKQNMVLGIGQQKKQTNTVREYLQDRKNELSLEQSIAKLELDAVRLNEGYEERVLSVKDFQELRQIKKNDKLMSQEWPRKRKFGVRTQKDYKSLEKIMKKNGRMKKRMLGEEAMEKKNDSYPHTNDSLSVFGKR